MKTVMAFFSVRLLISGWVRLDKINFNLCRWAYCKVGSMVAITEQSDISASRHPSQFQVAAFGDLFGPPRRTIITTRGTSVSQTATRTTTTRMADAWSVVSGEEASLFLLF